MKKKKNKDAERKRKSSAGPGVIGWGFEWTGEQEKREPDQDGLDSWMGMVCPSRITDGIGVQARGWRSETVVQGEGLLGPSEAVVEILHLRQELAKKKEAGRACDVNR